MVGGWQMDSKNLLQRIGFMQGRLSTIVNDRIQHFPWGEWKEEFAIAKDIGINLMEWTLDYERINLNPLMNDAGLKEINKLRNKYDFRINSVTGDFFMQKPFWRASTKEEYDMSKKTLINVCSACEKAEIKILVIPLVDNSSIDKLNSTSKREIVEFFQSLTMQLNSMGLLIAFETDLGPNAQKEFISLFSNNTFGINYDIGNSASLGYNHNEEIQAYGDRIINVHIKDRKLGGNTVRLGEGNADIKTTLNSLNNINYTGNLILQGARSMEGKHKEILEDYIQYVYDIMAT